ncbi:MAG: glycosyltransferase [Pseudomonadota bacterium]
MSTSEDFYFAEFENRRPDPSLPHSPWREFVWQVLAVATAGLGLWYLVWRWTYSLNPDAMWFALPVVIAESLCYIGLLLFFHNLWQVRDTPRGTAPATRADCVDNGGADPVGIDVFITTYDEDPELVRLSIIDAVQTRYPHEVKKTIHVLDDGRRDRMRKVAEEEGVNYITRPDNIGFKAGNLRNAMAHTSGDFIVICDADTRLFPGFLENTMGYFRDQDVAWVQTPQWFYDIPEGESLGGWMRRRVGRIGGFVGQKAECIVGPVNIGNDPFGCDPKLFYDVILRRRNGANASFCCGAGSIHRRDAVLEAALRVFAEQVESKMTKGTRWIVGQERRRERGEELRRWLAHETEITPYKFHVSEDIYTSMVLHSDRRRDWKSVLHPEVEARMLSPQDLLSWAMQRFKYAGGTLDIGLNDNPLFRPGMSFRQKLMYAMTFWSYLAPLWLCVFLLAPIVSLVTGIAPVDAYSTDLFLHLLPFIVLHEVALTIGMWGINNRKGKLMAVAFFWLNIQAIWTVVRGRQIKFHVTPKMRQSGRFFSIVTPHLVIIAASLIAMGIGLARLMIEPTGEQIGLFAVNAFWASCNITALMVLVRAAFWRPPDASDAPTNQPALAHSTREALA